MAKDERIESDMTEDALTELERIAEGSRPHSPYFDNIHPYQERSEIAIVEDWAKEMRKLGHSVCKIRLNVDENGSPDDPPDVLANIDGTLVGIEVTHLVEHVSENQVRIMSPRGITIMKWKKRRGELLFSCSDADLGEDERKEYEQRIRDDPRMHEGGFMPWTLESFNERLSQIIRKKDRRLGVKKKEVIQRHINQGTSGPVQEYFLLIFTPEPYLLEYLDTYLNETVLPRTKHFERVIMMGDYIPDGDSGHHPVFDLQLPRAANSRR
ncbi:MAG: hypothetical protein OXH99_13880 [Bryobacterales bacterium]|nr:hypothetical protein [Bryobacterales bacterium]